MGKSNTKIKNSSLKWFVSILLAGIILFAIFPTRIKAQKTYDTNFDWIQDEEAQHEWPLEEGLSKTNTGIGTAGFSYLNYYYNDDNQIVLELELSMFPKSPNNVSSAFRSFREQWSYANIFIDPTLVTMVDENASFFMMSYPADPASVSLSQAIGKTGTVYKLNVDQVYPKMPTNSDYMKSKLYLVLNDGVVRADLNEDYALELRYTNDRNQVYNQTGSSGRVVLGDYHGYNGISNYDAGGNNDDVTLKTVAPFQTASMTNVLPNPYLPPDMMRTVGQSVIYDNINGKLHVYYKQAPNHYIYTNSYANNGYFLSSWIGIRQVMDSRIYDALKPDANGVVGQMKMLDLNGIGESHWSVSTDIRQDEFSYIEVDENTGTYSYMMVPNDFKTNIEDKAIVPENHTNNVKNVYLHGYNKEADYVRFIYNVDKNKMDALFKEANSSTFSISTSYITDRPEDKIQTEYRLTPNTDIVIPKGAMIIFDLPKDSRSVFKAGLANNYERLIGNLRTRRPGQMNLGVDPRDYGEGYTVTPYSIMQGGFVLTSEAGLKIPSGDTIRLVMFDDTSPETVKMTVATGMHGANRTDYYLTKQPESVNKNNVYTMANANVRSGIIINRSANTPHINEFFTDSTAITGHSKYPNALVSARKVADNLVFKEANSSTTPQNFTAEGETQYTFEGQLYDYSGYAFTLDLPGDIGLKKDMALSFSNAAAGYFRSVPATYRTQARVTFDQNGGTGESVKRSVPINQKAYGEDGYSPNGFEGPNILWLDAQGNDAPLNATEKYLSDYEGLPITDTSSDAYKDRQFYGKPDDLDAPTRDGYTFLGWSTKKVDSMGSAAFSQMEELDDVSQWDEDTNYKFTATSPVDQSRTVYAVWEKDLYQYDIILHSNNANGENPEITEKKSYTLAELNSDVNFSLPIVSTITNEESDILHNKGFNKDGYYFVGWTEGSDVENTTKVEDIYTNGSSVKLVSLADQTKTLQLTLNPKEADGSRSQQNIDANNISIDNGIATINLYAQYKPLLPMTATKEWYAVGEKAKYELWAFGPDPENTEPEVTPLQEAPFSNDQLALVLLRTTTGKDRNPSNYTIIGDSYKKGTANQNWQLISLEGHDPSGQKYSYIMAEFSATDDKDTIIGNFNNNKSWASLNVFMPEQANNNLSKYSSITLSDASGQRYFDGVTISTQNDQNVLDAVSEVKGNIGFDFTLKNFEVEIESPIINRMKDGDQAIVIAKPKAENIAKLKITLHDNEDDGNVLKTAEFTKQNDEIWSSDNPDASLTVDTDGSLRVSFNDVTLEENNLITAQFKDSDNKHSGISKSTVQPYKEMPQLTSMIQVKNIQDADGAVTHNVISVDVPANAFTDTVYYLGYKDANNFNNFVEVKLSQELNAESVTAKAVGQILTFKVPAGILEENVAYFIKGVDPREETNKIWKDTVFNVSTQLDLTPPEITVSDVAAGLPNGINILTEESLKMKTV